MKLLYLLFLTLVFSYNYKGIENSDENIIEYDIILHDNIIKHNNTNIKLCTDNKLIINNKYNYNIGDIISFDICNKFVGKVKKIINNNVILERINPFLLIEKGKIKIYKLNYQNHEKHYCFGFNVNEKTCEAPFEIYELFKNEWLNVQCDNCYMKFDTDFIINIEFEDFSIKKIDIGFHNLKINGGLGINIFSKDKYIYSYEKLYKILDHLDLIDFDIAGLFHINVWLDLPVNLLYDTYLLTKGELIAGTNLIWDLNGLYLTYTPKEGIILTTPSGNPKLLPYFNTSSSINGESHFRLIPSLELHLNELFEFDIICDTNTYANIITEKEKICLQGNGDVIMKYKGYYDIDTKKYFGPKEFYNSGNIDLGKICI